MLVGLGTDAGPVERADATIWVAVIGTAAEVVAKGIDVTPSAWEASVPRRHVSPTGTPSMQT